MKMETLMKQTNNELRDIAWAEGVPYSKLNKADLVARILDYHATCKGKRVFDKNFIPDCFKTQICVTKLLMNFLGVSDLFQINLKRRKCVKKPLMNILSLMRESL